MSPPPNARPPRQPRGSPRNGRWRAALAQSAPIALGLGLAAPGLQARVLLTQQQALAEAFPAEKVERRSAFLTEDQAKKIEQLAGSPLPTRVISYYVASREAKPAGTVYFDTHLVRTLPETLMIVIDPSGAITKVEVLSFDEPPEYLPRPRWFEQFRGRRLDKDLAPGRAIPLVTGATISSRAATEAARRALALHSVLMVASQGPPAPAGETPAAPKKPEAHGEERQP